MTQGAGASAAMALTMLACYILALAQEWLRITACAHITNILHINSHVQPTFLSCYVSFCHSIYIYIYMVSYVVHIDGLVQDCSIYSVSAMEIPQSCTEPLINKLSNFW